MTKVQIIKEYFGPEDSVYAVTNRELLDLRKADPDGYEWVATESAKALGIEINQATS